MFPPKICAVALFFSAVSPIFAANYLEFAPKGEGPGQGKHVVLLAGDEEYRSEEALPMLAKILSQRHGFKCTVLFSAEEDGTIQPGAGDKLTHPEALDSAEALVLSLRFRHWGPETVERFKAAVNRGVPIIGLRTSTHAFNDKALGGFGKDVLGEKWVSHWGSHRKEATRGILEPGADGEAILHGVREVFGMTDVYEAYPPADARVLLRGQVLAGMDVGDVPANYRKPRATDKQEQPVNDPMMPIAWTREVPNGGGSANRVFCTTMGSASDLTNEGLRRLVVNGVFWGLNLDVPQRADVRYVDPYEPTMYGFKAAIPDLKVDELGLGKALPNRGQVVGLKRLELKAGDHVAIVGSGLADRQQHHGWLETLIHGAFPDLELTVRNLGFATDEVNLHPRSDEVPTTEYFLNMKKGDLVTKVGNTEVTYKAGTDFHANVILAYWGFNESFRGEAGLADFRKNLDEYLKKLAGTDFGKGQPRVVLLSPIAHENLRSDNFPDGRANNVNLALYTAAMAEVAAANKVPFVNLYAISKELYRQASSPLTINGIHLSEAGDKALAPEQFKALFGIRPPSDEDDRLARIRQAVLDKNREWHHRYRTVDQYNIYGGRSRIVYQDASGKTSGFTNAMIVGEEMAQRDVKTANRDRLIWVLAKMDRNLPPVTSTPANRPESVPYLSGEEAIRHLKLPEGCRVELVADETMFPELVNPVQMNFDTRGRLWVAAWPSYPETTPTTKVYDKLLVLDLDPKTGKATRCTTFLDGLNCPTGFQFHKDGVIVMQSPDLWFVRDVNGDGKVDAADGAPERLLHGLDAADSHHETNSICYEPGGAMYLSDGVFHRTNVETLQGPVRNVNGAIYRFEPFTSKFERYIPYGFANPHGRVFDAWGNDIVTDATGNANYFGPGFSSFLSEGAHGGYQQFWNRPSRPCPGTAILSSRHFPESWQGQFLNTNVISFQGIFRADIKEEGSGLKGETVEPLVENDIAGNPNFRPSGVAMAPDGSLYFMDWSQMLIGHLQHHLRDPNRDHQHGRIYRITFPSRPLLKPKKIYGEAPEKLVELLSEPENDVRLWTKIELSKHPAERVVAAVQRWAKQFDAQKVEDAHHLLEALWVHQWHNKVNLPLLKTLLNSPEPRARAQAVRVLCYQRDRVPEALSLLMAAAKDESPRVRLEAVRAASFFDGESTPKALEIAYEILRKPTDYYLEYCFKETLRQLQSVQKNLKREAALPTDPELLNGLIKISSDSALLELPAGEAVLQARLERKGYAVPVRQSAVQALARLHNVQPVAEMLSLFRKFDGSGGGLDGASAELIKVLVAAPREQLKGSQEALLKLALESRQPVTRRAGWAGATLALGNAEVAWSSAKSAQDQAALLQSLALIPDPALRAGFQPYLTAVAPGASGGLLKAIHQALPLMGPTNAEANFRLAAANLVAGKERESAVGAIGGLPRASWQKELAGPVAESVLAYAKGVDPKNRSQQGFLEITQLGMEMAGLAANSAVRKELRGLGVSSFVVKTVHEQMRFDTQRLVVEKGKPFEILLENADVMPHNLVIVEPGKHMEVGMAAATMGPNDNRDRQGRTYLPKGHRIIDATRLLEPGQKEKLQVKPIGKEGEYEFVCTFPGHAALMWGKLVVTADVDAYLEKNPTASLDGTGGVHPVHASASPKP